MSSVKPKRRKIPYIGKPPTASEIAAAYPLTPEMQKSLDRALAKLREKRDRGRRKNRISSDKSVRAK